MLSLGDILVPVLVLADFCTVWVYQYWSNITNLKWYCSECFQIHLILKCVLVSNRSLALGSVFSTGMSNSQ